MKRLFAGILVGAVVAAGALAPKTARAQGKAGQAGEFLRWGVGAKALGLGRAFTSIADDASAMYWNPAGMSSLTRNGASFMFMHLPLSEGASMNYLGGAVPLRLFFVGNERPGGLVRALQDLKLGVGVVWHSLGNFDFYDANASPVTSGSSSNIGESAFLFSASYPLNRVFGRSRGSGWSELLQGDLELGVTVKLLRQNLFGEHGSATSFDLGVKYSHVSGLFNLGFAWRDLSSPALSYQTNLVADRVPAQGVVGVSVRPPFASLRGLMLSFDYTVVSAANRDREPMFGVEYDLSALNSRYPVKLRLGSNSKHEALTLGLHFSPEELFGQDWLPSGDWTYADTRSDFAAVGARYSFSLDRNPFTARYWYQRAMTQFESYAGRNASERLDESSETSRPFLNAEEAKNPDKRAYRYEAALRLADIGFLSEVSRRKLAGRPQDGAQKKFAQVTRNYVRGAAKYMRQDYGKPNLDMAAYFRSFLFYAQSLVLSGKPEAAVAACASGGTSWGRGKNLRRLRDKADPGADDNCLTYVQAYAAYSAAAQEQAVQLLEKSAGVSVARFLRAHIRFLQHDYRGARQLLDGIDLNDTRFPENIYLPITEDRTFGDEALFLRAASTYRLAEGLGKTGKLIAEFAKIPRYFPNSDVAKFLTNGNAILNQMIALYESGDSAKVDELINSVIVSYIKTFSGGTLVEEFYTLNYR